MVKLLTLLGDRQSFYFRLGILLFFVGFLLSFIFFPFRISSDGEIRYEFMETLVHQAHILPMKYSMVGPLFSLPLWPISSLLKLEDSSILIARYNFLLVVLLILILYLWFRDHFDRRFLLTFFFFLAFGSMFPAHLLNYFGEVFSAVCLTLGAAGLALKKMLTGWVLLILAVLNTPPLLIPFIFIVLYVTWESKKLRYLTLVPACLILMLVENYLRTNSVTTGFQTYISQDHGFTTVLPYSGRIGFSFPFAFGVLSILFSFGKGLIFYCPGLLLLGWAWKIASDPIERKLIILWLLITTGLILAYASWWAWYGGWFWGPRFFLFASVPASWILARLVHDTKTSISMSVVLLLCITLSFWVGADGVVFNQRSMGICSENNYALEHLCWYAPEFSALWRPFVVQEVFSKRLLLLFAVPWLYIVGPLGIAIYYQLRTIFQTNWAHFRLSSWKF